MWMQQGEPKCLWWSVGIRARYCRRIVSVQVLKKKSLAIPVRRPYDRVSLRGRAGALYARTMTPACASQHPFCLHTHSYTPIHSHTRMRARAPALSLAIIYGYCYQYNIGKEAKYICMYRLKNSHELQLFTFKGLNYMNIGPWKRCANTPHRPFLNWVSLHSDENNKRVLRVHNLNLTEEM